MKVCSKRWEEWNEEINMVPDHLVRQVGSVEVGNRGYGKSGMNSWGGMVGV